MAPLPSPAEAESLVRRHVRPLRVESRPLEALAGAVLAQDVHAERDQPPFHRVTMDGIAIASADWARGQRRFRVAGILAAGQRPRPLPTGECLEVMTGAVLPPGSDCVVPVERLELADGWAEVDPGVAAGPMVNVHTRGLDCRAGAQLLASGTRIGPAELAVIASAGLPRAEVRTAPRIVIVSTGDELVAPGEPIEDWQVRRSNASGLRAVLARRGYADVVEDHLRDDPAALRERLAAHLAARDVLVLSGGVSMGRFDFVPQVLRELGVTELLHRVAQRPGKPLWFGRGPAGQTVFGLPGNPVSALICAVRYVLPALAQAECAAAGPPERAPLAAAFRVTPPLWYFLPVELEAHPVHGTAALPRPTRGSGDFVSLLGTDGFVELPPGPAEFPAGHLATLYRW